MIRQMFFKAGTLEDFLARGWLKTVIYGRRVFVIYVDDEVIALDGGAESAKQCEAPIPAEFYGQASMLLASCDGSEGRHWGMTTQYPVRIEGDSILVGSQSFF